MFKKPMRGKVMLNLVKRRSRKAGLPPGTLVHIGERQTREVKITVIDYDEHQCGEREVKSVDECFPVKDSPSVTWINIDGVHQLEIIEKVGFLLGIHPLTQEDIVNTTQRPKMEDFGDYIYIVLKMFDYSAEKEDERIEQISLILGPNYVVSFQEREGDIFDHVRERIRKGKGRSRKMGADYLAYTLVDAIVDEYFLILERMGERIEVLEDELISDPKPETLQQLHHLKREMIFLRKSVWPLREVISGLERIESALIRETMRVFLKDVYDHTIQVIDAVETYRDMLSGMLDTYLSSVSNRMNEVMKVLTIIATIFIPLTFIAGIYGMNFKFMPELDWHWGYFLVWGVMIVITIVMLVYFRRKKWL